MEYAEIKDGPITLTIDYDECAESPREWDNLGTMVCWHDKYVLGDKHYFDEPQSFYNEVHNDNAIILPLYLYDHSGITISTGPFACMWDSGPVGYIYVTKDQVRQEYGAKRISQKLRDRVINVLINEIETFDMYIKGECFSYLIMDGEHFIDSCSGFYGDDWNQMKVQTEKEYQYLFDEL